MWRSTVGALDDSRLVFVDEMGAHTSLAPLYAYSPRGKRAFFKVPRNRGKNTTLLASIGCEGMGPSMAVEGPTTKEVFEASTGSTFWLLREAGAGGCRGQLRGPQGRTGQGADRR